MRQRKEQGKNEFMRQSKTLWYIFNAFKEFHRYVLYEWTFYITILLKFKVCMIWKVFMYKLPMNPTLKVTDDNNLRTNWRFINLKKSKTDGLLN